MAKPSRPSAVAPDCDCSGVSGFAATQNRRAYMQFGLFYEWPNPDLRNWKIL